MKFIVSMLTGNWGLKLLALALAVILYHALKQESDSKTPDNDRSIIQKP